MGTYKIYARRNPYSDWTIWCNTDDEKAAEYNKRVIESYGYEWTDEELMTRNAFKVKCYGKGIKLSKVNKFMEGRFRFSTSDIKTLEELQNDGAV